MLPVQKRKAPSSAGSSQTSKSARTEEAPGRGGHRGKGDWRKAAVQTSSPPPPALCSREAGARQDARPEPPASETEPGLRASPVAEEQGAPKSRGSGVVTGAIPSDHTTDGNDAKSPKLATAAVGAQDDGGSNHLAGEPSAARATLEAPPAVSSTSGSGASEGPSAAPCHSLRPEMPHRGGRQGTSTSPTPGPPGGTPSEDEKDEGDRNLVITMEEGDSAAKKMKKKKVVRRETNRPECNVQLDDTFERALEDGAKTHNLTAINVRNILHTNRAKEMDC
ncbi:GON-4-like protein [Scyliorhinus canicula]|uniref:GON-4-like protein n=1 Tax=Scyliorhinus canicula TaxID=7830 RepID=UPI0018F50E09|nr:GON-4-like protein [Scyliorhinus canicula]